MDSQREGLAREPVGERAHVERAVPVPGSENPQAGALPAHGVALAFSAVEARRTTGCGSGHQARSVYVPALVVDLGESARERRGHGPYQVVNAARRPVPVDAAV